jgi:hypothetical protein
MRFFGARSFWVCDSVRSLFTDELDDEEESSIASSSFVPWVPSLGVLVKSPLTASSGSSNDGTVAGDKLFLGAVGVAGDGVIGGLFRNISARESTTRLVALW